MMSTNNRNSSDIMKTARISLKIILRVLIFFIIIGAAVAVFTISTGAGYFASLVKDEPIQSYEEMKRDIYNYEESSKMYFASEKYIGDIQADLQRDEVKLENISPILIDAVLATEDENFYEHNGVVPKAIFRAVLQEVSNSDVKTGGSTLTQQLIKNQILTNEVSFDRKAKEILLAIRLENNFTKDDILEAYLNVIPYGRAASGRNIAGIQTASQGIFGVDANELNLAQAAYLAGMPQNPYTYTPFTVEGKVKDDEELQYGFDRMKVVLKRMHTAEVITKKEYDEALNYDLVEDFTEKKTSPLEKYPVLVFEIEKRAKEILMKQEANNDGYSIAEINEDENLKEEYSLRADRALRMNGYNVHTTIDKDIYDGMQDVAKKYKHYGPDRTFTEKDPNTGESKTFTESVEAGAVLIENNSGKIISFVGNRDASVDDHFNFAMNAKRQPGSTLKPLAVYAPGFDLGTLQPASVLPDVPDRKGYSPPNYANSYYGLITAREAMTKSHNVSTVEAYKQIINENPAKKYLAKMNMKLTNDDETNPSLALGTNNVSVEENTSAFTTLANNGEYAESYMIEKITTRDDEVIYEHNVDPVKVFSPQAAYLTIDIMRDVLKRGTATYVPSQLKTSNVDWAGKTGTTNDYFDAWFVGTNPNVTMGAWIGYQTPASLKCDGCALSYSKRNQTLWTNLVNKATEINPELMAPKGEFKQPKGIVKEDYCAISGLAPSELCEDVGLVKSDIFDAKHKPSKEDDSLVGQSGSTKLVRINGKDVVAGDKTPSEFTYYGKSTGFAFNPEFLKDNDFDELNDLSVLFPRTDRSKWEKISTSRAKGVASSTIKDNGKAPSPASGLNISGQTLSWNSSSSNDVVGYRVYKDSSRIGTTTSTSYTLPKSDGAYSVKAVDYFGRESSSSKSVDLTVKKETPQKDKDKSDDKKNETDEKDDQKDDKDKDKNEDQDKKDEEDEEDKDKKTDKEDEEKKKAAEKKKKEAEAKKKAAEKKKKEAEAKKKAAEKKKDKDD